MGDAILDPNAPVSLVVPLRNEASTLGELIASIRRQTLPPAEIVLVDGGSTDATVAVAQRLIAGDLRFRLIEAGPATPGRGRNIGIAAAGYEWVALTDAGIRLDPDWLRALVDEVRRQPDVDIVYGAYEPVQETFFERCAALAYVAAPISGPNGAMRGGFIASSMVRRSAWEAVGGFPDLRAAEDLIFMERVAQAGFREAWASGARVAWRLQPTLAGTYRRFADYSRHNVLAGRQRFWHYAIARQYAAGALLVTLSATASPWWLAVPAIAFAAKVGRRIWRHRGGRGWLWCINPLQFALVAVVVLAVDFATFVGWARAGWEQWRR